MQKMWHANAEGDNMRLKRKIDEYLREWKKSKNKMPFILFFWNDMAIWNKCDTTYYWWNININNGM